MPGPLPLFANAESPKRGILPSSPVKTSDALTDRPHYVVRAKNPEAREDDPRVRPADERGHYLEEQGGSGFGRLRKDGQRNLIGGVVVLLLCIPLFGWALAMGGPRAAMAVATAFATATTLYVVARCRIFHQRNGGFLALAIVCLTGVWVALVQEGWLRMNTPIEHASKAPEAGDKPAGAPPSAGNPPALVDALMIPPPDPNRGRRVKVLKNSTVKIGGETFLIRAGDIFPLVTISNGQARFQAGMQQIELAQELVEVLKPAARQDDDSEETAGVGLPKPSNTPGASSPSTSGAAEKPSDITERAQREAVRRYPGLGRLGDPENELFLTRVQELKLSGSTDFFKAPDWPLRIAEMLAHDHGWKAQDEAADPAASESPKADADGSAPMEQIDPEAAEKELLKKAK